MSNRHLIYILQLIIDKFNNSSFLGELRVIISALINLPGLFGGSTLSAS